MGAGEMGKAEFFLDRLERMGRMGEMCGFVKKTGYFVQNMMDYLTNRGVVDYFCGVNKF